MVQRKASLRGEIYPPLTPRELQVVKSYMKNWSYDETGKEVGMSSSTVSSRLTRARQRYGMETSSALVVHLISIGILDAAV